MTEAEHKRNFIQQIPRIWLEFVAIGLILGVILVNKIVGSSADETVTILALMAAVLFRLLPSATRIIAARQALQFYSPMFNNLMLELDKSKKHEFRVPKKVSFRNSISLKNISFSYDKKSAHAQILKDLSIEIKKGEKIVIFGKRKW